MDNMTICKYILCTITIRIFLRYMLLSHFYIFNSVIQYYLLLMIDININLHVLFSMIVILCDTVISCYCHNISSIDSLDINTGHWNYLHYSSIFPVLSFILSYVNVNLYKIYLHKIHCLCSVTVTSLLLLSIIFILFVTIHSHVILQYSFFIYFHTISFLYFQ